MTALGVGPVIVGQTRTLRKILLLRLVEIASTRSLLAVDHGHDFHGLQIALLDALEDNQEEKERKRTPEAASGSHESAEESCPVSKAEILFVSLP